MNTPHISQTKRVTVPVDVEVVAAFERLAAASGTSVGKAMGTWLADTMEGAVAMSELLEKARKAPKQAVRELHSYALGLTDMTQEFVDHVNKASIATGKALVKAKRAEGGPATPGEVSGRLKGSRLAGALKQVTPPVGNTGGKLPLKPKTGRGRNA